MGESDGEEGKCDPCAGVLVRMWQERLTHFMGLEIVSLKATLGFPVTHGQLYSVRNLCVRVCVCV